MRWTQAALKTRAPACGRRSRVVLTPRRRRQVSRGDSADDGDKKARSPGRARNKPLKPLRAGMPGDSGGPVVTTLVCFVLFRTRGRGCIAHPAFPTPSFGRMVLAQLGRLTPRECGVVSRRHCEERKRRSNPFLLCPGHGLLRLRSQ